MANLIDKDALIAKIEKLEKALKNACKPNPFGNTEECMTAAELEALDLVKDTIDTLEVKEVDLEEEIKLNYNPVDGLEFEEYKRIAKYYFELGLAQKGEKI